MWIFPAGLAGMPKSNENKNDSFYILIKHQYINQTQIQIETKTDHAKKPNQNKSQKCI